MTPELSRRPALRRWLGSGVPRSPMDSSWALRVSGVLHGSLLTLGTARKRRAGRDAQKEQMP